MLGRAHTWRGRLLLAEDVFPAACVDLELATAMDIEDTVLLKGGDGSRDSRVFGKVSDGGDVWSMARLMSRWH